MTDRIRPYLFYDVAVSICSQCYRKVEGKIVFEDGKVFLLKHCPRHGNERSNTTRPALRRGVSRRVP